MTFEVEIDTNWVKPKHLLAQVQLNWKIAQLKFFEQKLRKVQVYLEWKIICFEFGLSLWFESMVQIPSSDSWFKIMTHWQNDIISSNIGWNNVILTIV